MQNAWVLNQEILINPELYHPCKLPVTCENILVDFVAYWFDCLKLKFTTIKLYLCGIRYGYMIQGVTSPFNNIPLQRLHAAIFGYQKNPGFTSET